MEIQKAEEFAMIALDIYSDEVLPKDQHNIHVLADLIRSRDKAIIESVIAIFDEQASFDPHGFPKGDGSRDAIIYCNDQLRASLAKFKADLS